jgi:hypothetical protein
MNYIHKYYTRHRPRDPLYNLPKARFIEVIRRIHHHLIAKLLSGDDIILPLRMGRIEVRKINATLEVKDGKVKTNRKVDWHATLKMWYEYPHTKLNKQLVYF